MTRRVPVMRPAPRGGLAARSVLEEQVRVTPDGAVEAAGRVLAPGAVRRAVLLSRPDTERLLGPVAPEGGALVLLDAVGDPLLALLLLDWSPPAVVDDAGLRAVTGVDAVCRALGLPLEPAEPADLDRLARSARGALHRPGPGPRWPGQAGWPMSWAAVLLSIGVLLVVSAADGARTQVSGVVGLLAAVLALCVAVPTVLGAVALRRAGAAPGLGSDAVVVRASPSADVPSRVRSHELQLTPDLLLLRRFGAQVALPGPAAGGVVQAVLEPSAVRLRDADGRPYSSLSAEVWCGTPGSRDVLRDALRLGGLTVLDAPVDALDSLDLDELSTDGVLARLRARPGDTGELFRRPGRLVALATGAAALAAYGAYDSGADWQGPPAVVLGTACAVLTVVVIGLRLAAARTRRRDASPVVPDARGVVTR